MKDKLDEWNDFCGTNFLKADQVANEQDFLVVDKVEVFEDEEKSTPRLTMARGEETFTFDLNVTNSNFCKNNGINSPRQLLGKKLYFKKVNVMSPKLKKEVESLRICKIE